LFEAGFVDGSYNRMLLKQNFYWIKRFLFSVEANHPTYENKIELSCIRSKFYFI
jgi:hypothetical protein